MICCSLHCYDKIWISIPVLVLVVVAGRRLALYIMTNNRFPHLFRRRFYTVGVLLAYYDVVSFKNETQQIFSRLFRLLLLITNKHQTWSGTGERI